MTDILPSYVQDAWWVPDEAREHDGDSSGTVVRDASTGASVTRISTDGLDLAAALDHARTVGQQSLGALTFHQRAVLLKQFATTLGDRKEELYELSLRAGATRRDSQVAISIWSTWPSRNPIRPSTS